MAESENQLLILLKGTRKFVESRMKILLLGKHARVRRKISNSLDERPRDNVNNGAYVAFISFTKQGKNDRSQVQKSP